ncbi:MAG: hypothetical protein KC503_40145, partial [Myxococcales bacterium]|nr:hypothetical protein [Myxococcales bacterium]
MSGDVKTDLSPLAADVQALLDAERARPPIDDAMAARIAKALSARLDIPIDGGGGDGGGGGGGGDGGAGAGAGAAGAGAGAGAGV